MTSPKLTSVVALLLVGGLGTRLRGVLDDCPKPMASILGRPFAEWLLLWLKLQGIRRVVMCTGHMGDMVEAHFGHGDAWGVEVAHAQDPYPLGTGGSVRNGAGVFRAEHYLVLNGDSFFDVNLERLLSQHTDAKATASLGLVSVEDCGRYGAVEVTNDNRLVDFKEKSSEKLPGLINAGVYWMTREAILQIPDDRKVSLEREIFPHWTGNGLFGFVSQGLFYDIGTPEALSQAPTVLENTFQKLAQIDKRGNH